MCADFDSDGYDKLNINIIQNDPTDLNFFTQIFHHPLFFHNLGKFNVVRLCM